MEEIKSYQIKMIALHGAGKITYENERSVNNKREQY